MSLENQRAGNHRREHLGPDDSEPDDWATNIYEQYRSDATPLSVADLDE